jgi:Ca2+:H+ antiporter
MGGDDEGGMEAPTDERVDGCDPTIAPAVVKPGTLVFSLSRPGRALMLLLLAAPLAIAANVMGGGPALTFSLAAIGIIPLAALMGRATEELAHRSGPGVSGLLNATFGNATELIIAGFAIKEGLFAVAKASIAGSIVGNVLLVMGLSFTIGGLRHTFQRFQTSVASAALSMLTVSVVGITMPSMYHYVQNGFEGVDSATGDVVTLSGVIAVVLLGVYVLYLVFSLRTHRLMFDGDANGAAAWRIPRPEPSLARWSKGAAILVLAITTLCVAAMSEVLVGEVEPLVEQLGISELFLGVIVIAIIGNAAEHSTAILMAWRGRTELSFQIAMGSSTQIALLVAPVLVFLSFALGNPMALVFEPFELVSMILTLGLATVITLDGEATWFEGAMLVAIFIVVAAVFYLHP